MVISGYTPEELKDLIPDLKKYRYEQIFSWIHSKRVSEFDFMTNLPKDLILKLKENFKIRSTKIEKIFKSKLDDTIKLLFKLEDNLFVEGVILKYKYGYTMCISSQVGCNMGCTFCASTKGGLIRNLKTHEMVDMLYLTCETINTKINHIVFMGMGEPFDNYDNVVRFLKIINDSRGYNLSYRRITVSTCGIVDKIYQFADENIGVTLAISLHSSEQDIRKKIMPVSKKYPVDSVVKAAVFYQEKTGRRVSIEYALIKDENSSEFKAKKLSALLKGKGFHVNLIPVNQIDGMQKGPPKKNDIESFRKVLEESSIHVTIRRELGKDISGSCGQLSNSINLI